MIDTKEKVYAWLPEEINHAEDIDLVDLEEASRRFVFYFDADIKYKLVRVSNYPVGQTREGDYIYVPVEVLRVTGGRDGTN